MRQLARIADLTEEDWKHLRRKGIGGSDAATLLGHNPWRDAFCVYVDKVCDELAPDIQRESTYWGTQLEPLVAQEFQKRHPEFIVHKPAHIIGSSEHDWAFGSLDYLLLDASSRKDACCEDDARVDLAGYLCPDGKDDWYRVAGVLEIKTTSTFYGKHWEAGVPPYAYTQAQHYLLVTGLPVAWVACLVGGQRYVNYPCPRDDRVISQIIEKGIELMDRVARRDPPEPDPSKSDVLEAIERFERSKPVRPKHEAVLTLPGWTI